jgi:hypothetical protein
MGGADMWMECLAGDAGIEDEDAEVVAERFLAHAGESHDLALCRKALHQPVRGTI